MTRVNPQTLATAASPSTSCTSKSRRRIRPGDNNNVAAVCTNIPSLSSKSKHQGNGHHFAAIAERGFRNAAATAVLELMQEHGYSRERAVCALLHEISSSGQTANSTRPTDDKVRNTRSIDQGLACYPCVFAGCSRVFEIDLSQTLPFSYCLLFVER